MIRNFAFLVLFIIFGSTIGLAASKRYEYKVHVFPTTGETCQSNANAVAEQFTLITKRAVVRAYCQKTFSQKLDIVIIYNGDYELKLISTKNIFQPDQGLYKTMQECQSQLGQAIETFRLNTSLEPVVGYCYSDYSNTTAPAHPFAIRIDGFGMPTMWPKTKVWTFYEQPLFDQNTFADFVKNRAVSMEILNPQVAFDYTLPSYRLMMSYYSPTHLSLPLDLQVQAVYDTPDDCKNRQGEIYRVLKAADAEPLVVFCSVNTYSRYVSLQTLVYTKGAYGSEFVGGAYRSLQECDADKELVKEVYRTTFDQDVIDGICSLQSEEGPIRTGVHMKLFFRL